LKIQNKRRDWIFERGKKEKNPKEADLREIEI